MFFMFVLLFCSSLKKLLLHAFAPTAILNLKVSLSSKIQNPLHYPTQEHAAHDLPYCILFFNYASW